MLNLLSVIFLLISNCCPSFSSADCELALVQILFRHGDRSPVYFYPTSDHQADAWPRGKGQLTKTGIWRSYNLGQFLKRRYIDTKFLPSMFNVGDVAIRSTGYDRTIMTAQAVLTGMYPPEDGDARWNEDDPGFPWQPIPIHSVPKKEDLILKYGNKCPRYQNLKYDIFKTDPSLKQLLNNSADILAKIRNESGFQGQDFMMYELYDTLKIEGQNNFTVPQWADGDVMKVLREITVLDYQLLTATDEMKRLAAGNLLALLLNNMKDAVSKVNFKKAFIYSAHDSTIMALFGALAIDFHELPPYSACIIFELCLGLTHPYVNVFFRNDTSIVPLEPVPLTLPACPDTSECPLGDVLTYYNSTRHLVVRDYDAECLATPTPTPITSNTLEPAVIGLALFSVVLVLLLVGSAIYILRQRRRQSASMPSMVYEGVKADGL